ncbi:protein FAM136A [Ambystoma mexicanum]|uniref:protein FAM136A n=1 Tax=Ambystoma mexicanum TaxID=8296 RepID=UPI0037E92A68
MAGVEEQQLRLQKSVDAMVEGLERENIRVMQGKMFRCSAQCCEIQGSSMQQVHQCIERCHAPMGQAQSVVTSELERFQNRLARCSMNCNDKAKDALDTGAKETQVKLQLESCVSRCADEHMNLIPSMTRKLKESLASVPQ